MSDRPSPHEIIELATKCKGLIRTRTGRNDEQYWVLTSYAHLDLGDYEKAGKDAIAAYVYAYGNSLRDGKGKGTGDYQGIPAMLMAVSRLLWAETEQAGDKRLRHQLEQAYLFGHRGLWAAGCGLIDEDVEIKTIQGSDLTLDGEGRDRICQESMLVMSYADIRRGNTARGCRRLSKYQWLLRNATAQNSLARLDFKKLMESCSKGIVLKGTSLEV